MQLITRSFDNIPPDVLGYNVYSISTTRPQQYRDIPVLWLYAPAFEVQIEYNLTKNCDIFKQRMAVILKQRASAIGDWVKANSEAKICLACWEGVDFCHRPIVAEAVKQAGEKSAIPVKIDIG